MKRSEIYTYKDFVTGRIRRTSGKFIGWSKPTGPLSVKYATFKTPHTYVNVPAYCLTAQTKERIMIIEAANSKEGLAKLDECDNILLKTFSTQTENENPDIRDIFIATLCDLIDNDTGDFAYGIDDQGRASVMMTHEGLWRLLHVTPQQIAQAYLAATNDDLT